MSSNQSTPDKALEGQLCPRYHRAIELVGKRWTGAIIRVLLAGPHRFNELLASVPGVSDRLLTERLRELEGEGLISRRVEPGSPVKVVYELTCAGAELQEPLDALGHWAEKWLTLQPGSEEAASA